MKLLEQITTSLSVLILTVSCFALLFFGWSESGWKALAIPTGSMRPTMPPGTLVLMHRVPAASLKVGDVITYISPIDPTRTISHRVIKKFLIGNKIPGFITKGDANKIADAPIAAGNVSGKVVWHIPSAGNWLLEAKKPYVILPVVYVAAILIMIEEVKRLNDYYKLGQPYRLLGFADYQKRPNRISRRVGYITTLVVVFVSIGAVAEPSTLALLKSNTVSLINNRISVAPALPIRKCTSNNNINISSASDQSASSGTASTTSSTSGGSSSSGNTSNSNPSSTNINIKNC